MYVELMPATTAIFMGELPSHELAALHALYAYHGKIYPIKFLRAAYPGVSLSSAKSTVEALARHYGWQQITHTEERVTLGDILREALDKAQAGS